MNMWLHAIIETINESTKVHNARRAVQAIIVFRAYTKKWVCWDPKASCIELQGTELVMHASQTFKWADKP